MRSAHLAALVPLVATSLLASSTHAAEPRALFVRRAAGAPAETTWIATPGGVRVYSDATGMRTAPVATPAPTHWIVRLEEPAALRSQSLPSTFAAQVQARRALDDRFLAQLARREPSRFGARGAQGLRVVHEYDRLIAGVALEAPASALAMLRATPGVARVDEDLPVHAARPQRAPGGG